MSFNHYSRKVRDSRLEPWVRLAALRSCISRLSFLKGQSYSAMLARLNQKYDFDRYKDRQLDLLPNEKSLLATLEEVEAERRVIVDQLRIFAKERVQKKRVGKRQLSSKEREYLMQLRMNLKSSNGQTQ